jgi:hypothetical protein
MNRDPIRLLANLYDLIIAAYRRLPPRPKIVSSFLALVAALAIAADFVDAGEMLTKALDGSQKAEAELVQVMSATGADRALLTRFIDGDREAVASVAQGGKSEVSRANQYTSLSVHPYDILYREHKAGRCWRYHYKLGTQRAHILDDGMARVDAQVLLSCPVVQQGRLLGAASVSFAGVMPPEAEAQKLAQLQRLALGLGEYLD